MVWIGQGMTGTSHRATAVEEERLACRTGDVFAEVDGLV